MTRTQRSTCATLMLGCVFALGCEADTTGLETLSVGEVAALLNTREGVTFCDANNEDTRSELGVLPGAVLLTSYRDYATSELPADRDHRLVFYCYNEMCGSAASAARRAVAAGFSNVSVMPDGVRGWVAAKQPVEHPGAG